MTLFSSRPFDRIHAEAGAPYCQRSGARATVLSWNVNGDTLVGLAYNAVRNKDVVVEWDHNGRQQFVDGATEYDLVMLPLGYIGTTPIFMDDEYIRDGEKITAMVMDITLGFAGCELAPAFWPFPNKVAMPVTEASEALIELAEINGALADVQGVSGTAVQRINQLIVGRDLVILELQATAEALRVAENKLTRLNELWQQTLA
jgi:hypothetical protein